MGKYDDNKPERTHMLGLSLRTNDVRDLFKALLAEKQFTSVNREATMTNLTGNTTIEIVNASFIADEDAIFGEVNWDYVKREEEWYNSQSLCVNDFPGGPPQIWKAVADRDGFINSNYGHAIYSVENGFALDNGHQPPTILKDTSQYHEALQELKKNPESRRAMMIYTRPSMWLEYNHNGRSDFMCTNAVQYLIRQGKLHAIVQMRSNDAVFGYKNDRAWQQHVLEKLANDLSIEPGNLYWNAGSLHVYARHYHLVDPINYAKP
jgi:thymidylate synthase